MWRAFSGGHFLGKINNNHNKSIFKVKNLVPRDYSKHIYTHTQTHRGTCTHKHSDYGCGGHFLSEIHRCGEHFLGEIQRCGGHVLGEINNNHNKSIFKVQNLVPREYSKHTHKHTEAPAHTSIVSVQVWRALSE